MSADPWDIAIVRATRIGHEGPEVWRAWASRRAPLGFHTIAEGPEAAVRAAAARWRAPVAVVVPAETRAVQVGLFGGGR